MTMGTADDQADNRVGLFGSGVIGSGWAAFYLARGYRAMIHDPAPEAEQRTREYLDRIWEHVRASFPGAPADAPHENLSFVTAAQATSGAKFVHEQGPENLQVKQRIYATIEESADPQTLILSSSGGLMPSLLQAEMKHPERLVVAHPLSPVYALPFVEILGGEKTSTAAYEAADEHLSGLGKNVIRLKREVPGYLVNRLTFAMVREAVHCLMEGVADAQAIEDAVIYGVTPRYVTAGPLTSLAVAGGAGGMQNVVDYFAPAIDEWWSDLGSPTMTPEVKEVLLRAAAEIFRGRSVDEIVAERDAAVVEIANTFLSADEGRLQPEVSSVS
jgi:3-hydroxyacyl-CoA dehydrogenase